MARDLKVNEEIHEMAMERAELQNSLESMKKQKEMVLENSNENLLDMSLGELEHSRDVSVML